MRRSLPWLGAVRRYLLVIAAGNLVWETLQVPFYTMWRTDPARSIARAVFHCTADDIAIASIALVLALATMGDARWPEQRWLPVAVAVLVLGASYTIWSEYRNTVLRGAWAYADAMPVLPVIGTGLAPLLQWIVVPTLALRIARGSPRLTGGSLDD
jgi:hypothetical protein